MQADREMSEYLEAKGIAERVHVHAIEEEQAEFEIVMAKKISSAFLGYLVRKDRRKYQELLRMRREEKANVIIVLAVRLCLAKRFVRALKKDRWYLYIIYTYVHYTYMHTCIYNNKYL